MQLEQSGTYTIMFTDMVDSTALRVELGESDADALRRRHDELLFKAVETNGGRVVKSTGDGIMAAFGSASNGIEAAVAAQRAVARYRAGTSALAPVQIRVGLSVGDVAAEDDDLFGTPVVEAARLEAAAQAGEILVSGLVRFMTRGRTNAEFQPVGELELKGLPDPVETFRIPWSSGEIEASPLPLPPRLVPRRAWPFVGRQAELGRLDDAWCDAQEYGLAAAFVAGEPGIGKTRLLQEFCHGKHADGAIVTFGTCSDTLTLAYRPFVEVLQQLHALGGPIDRLDPVDRDALGRLMPSYTASTTALDPTSDNDVARLRLFDAVRNLFSSIAVETPLIVVLDDLQWADPASLLLLRHLASNPPDGPTVVLGTFRDSEVGRGHPLADTMADLRRENIGERIPLSGLDPQEIRSLVSGRTTASLDHTAYEFIDTVGRESGGSPLYLTEIFRSLTETGVIAEVDGRWELQSDSTDFELPQGVREVIERRLSRLPESVVETLTAASVIGLGFDLGPLVQLSGVDVDDVLGSLETAVAARVVAEGAAHGEFEFTHAVVQRTLYESISVTRRGRLHQALAELSPDVADIQVRAHHAYEAQASLDVGASARLLLEAGQAEARRLAWESAATQLRRALEVLGPRAEREPALAAEIQLSLGSVLRLADDPDALRVLDAGSVNARAAGRGDLMAKLAMSKLRPGWWFPEAGHVDIGLVQELEEAAARLDDPLLRAQVLGATACALAFDDDRDRRVQLLAEAEATLPADCTPEAHHAIRAHRWVSLWDPDTTAERLELAAELDKLSSERRSIEGRCQAAICRLHCLIELGRFDEINEGLVEADALLSSASIPYFDWIVAMMRNLLATLRLEPDAETLFAATHAIGSGANADADVAFAAQMYGLAFQRNAVGDLAPFIEIQIAENPGFPAWNAAFALSLIESGQIERGRAIFDELGKDDFIMPTNMTMTIAYCTLIRTARALGREDAAEVLYRRLHPYSGRLDSAVGVSSAGPIDLYLAEAAELSGRKDLVEQHARAALEMARRFDAVACIRQSQDLLARC